MNNSRALLALRYLALVVLAILCVGPILIMFLTSFKTQSQTFTTGLSFFFVPTLENYRDVIFDSSFGRYLINSLIVGVPAKAIRTLDDEFADLRSSDQVDAELAALKARLNKEG